MPPTAQPSSTATTNQSTTSVNKLPSGPFANPTPCQLRSLVMDYLCHHCYTRTAVAFAKDSTVRHLDADGDEIVQPKEKGILAERDVLELSNETLLQAELRNEIRVKILSGHIDDAIGLLNEHFPSVLASPIPGKPCPSPSAAEAMNSNKHIVPTTTDPRHLLLNLRIQSFTELCRSRPLVYSSPSLPNNETDTSMSGAGNLDPDGDRLTNGREQASSSGSESDVDLMDMDSDTDTDTNTDHTDADVGDDPHVIQLVRQGQKLYALLDQIDSPAEKELYEQELVNVGALLAYPEPENSPLARYLSMERREAVAEQINKAILVRMGESPTSTIELLTRYTAVLWALANEMKIKARPGAIVPPKSQTQSPSTPLPTKQLESEQIVPSFNLQMFLEPR